MNTKIKELILIARCIKEENKQSERLISQCDRIEYLVNNINSDNFCKIGNNINECQIFISGINYGCISCANHIANNNKDFPKITKFRNKTCSDRFNEISTEGKSILQLLSNHHLEILEVAQSAKNIYKIGDEVRLKETSRIRKIKSFTIQENGIFYAHFDGNLLSLDITAAKLEDLF
jgi:hypothetical protein